MQRRKFGKLDFDVSLLGFGCMRLPTIENPDPASQVGNIDEQKAAEMIRYAIDHGVDYIDTAYNYHDGKSEILVGRVLQDGYRERVKLATKLPVWIVESEADCDRILNEQLSKLQTDYIDMYLLHSLGKGTWMSKVQKYNVFKFLDAAKADGRIKYAGFSFHDDLELFREIVDAYNWDFCQIQFNYMDEYYQAGKEGLKYAADKGLAVVIMEPLRGGRLVKNIPPEIQAIWEEAPIKRTPAEWAFKWVCNFPEVSVVLSGMGHLDQVKENINTMSEAEVNSLSQEELKIIGKIKDFYNARIKVDCTDCRYCLPCPQGVEIPRVFGIWNNASIYNIINEGKRQYDRMIKSQKDASRCIECGQCESVCPQNLTIIEFLKDAHKALV
ncbi:MAG: aldo/keto reductase [Firmicutes bacterium]|nr:aldo/keto reductase [Bacillota bacterium]